MKKHFIMAVLTVLCACMSMTVYAGDINAAEQRIVNLMDATFLVDNAYYKIKEEYAEKVVSYLNRDEIDMSDAEVTDYMNQFFANLRYGISEGYLIKVADAEKPSPKKEETSPEDETVPDNAVPADVVGADVIVVDEELGGHASADPDGGNVKHLADDPKDLEASGAVPDGKQVVRNETAAGGEATENKETSDADQIVFQNTDPVQTASDDGAAGKDYSDAAPLTKNMNIGVIALSIALIVLAVCAVTVIRYKAKDRKH